MKLIKFFLKLRKKIKYQRRVIKGAIKIFDKVFEGKEITQSLICDKNLEIAKLELELEHHKYRLNLLELIINALNVALDKQKKLLDNK